MNRQRTIKIFLLDGEPTGIKIAELSNWIGKAYLIPRNRLDSILKDEDCVKELNSQCVYLLIGSSEDDSRKVYVGEAEDFTKRIQYHNRNKDFWNLSVCFVSKDENLTKAHVKYLESEIAKKLEIASRVELENTTSPTQTKLPRSDRAEMRTFQENIELLMGSLGLTFFETLKTKSLASKDTLFCKGSRAEAAGAITNEGFVVYTGSKISKKITNSLAKGTIQKRESALTQSLMTDEGKHYSLIKSLLFFSPSSAASFVLGRSANGWIEWKTQSGKTLDELKRK